MCSQGEVVTCSINRSSLSLSLCCSGGSGLLDPCEKGVVDASAKLSAQERANITLSAQVRIKILSYLQNSLMFEFLALVCFSLQHALRLIAFGKLHLVLGVNPLPPPGTPRGHPPSLQQALESPSKGIGDAAVDETNSGVEVTPSAGLKRESTEKQEGSEGVKKIKLES